MKLLNCHPSPKSSSNSFPKPPSPPTKRSFRDKQPISTTKSSQKWPPLPNSSPKQKPNIPPQATKSPPPPPPSSSSSSKHLSKRQVVELEQAFKRFDKNGDGKISAEELGGVLRALGNKTSDEEARRIVREVDADGDGFIDLTEFIHLNTRGAGLPRGVMSATTQELREAFGVFDMDGKGFISREKLHRVLTNLGYNCSMDDCMRMIRGVDANGDGMVDFEEFKQMMLK